MMTTTKRNALIAFTILFLIALFSISTIDAGTLKINGGEIHELSGFSGFVVACLVGFVALFFALFFTLSITGLVLVVMSIVMVVVVAAVLGSIVLALLPLMIPILVLVGIVALFKRRKTA